MNTGLSPSVLNDKHDSYVDIVNPNNPRPTPVTLVRNFDGRPGAGAAGAGAHTVFLSMNLFVQIYWPRRPGYCEHIVRARAGHAGQGPAVI
jgi:hypothetical protein